MTRATTVGVPVHPLNGEPSGEPLHLAVPEAFEVFYRRSYGGLVALSAALIGDYTAAEDVVQDALYAAHRDWDRIGVLDSPLGWVRRMVTNKSVSFVRRRLSETRALARWAVRQPRSSDLPEDAMDFWRMVRRLPPRQAQVVALYYAADLTVAEIGHTLGVAEGSVKATLFKARAALARRLEAPDRRP